MTNELNAAARTAWPFMAGACSAPVTRLEDFPRAPASAPPYEDSGHARAALAARAFASITENLTSS